MSRKPIWLKIHDGEAECHSADEPELADGVEVNAFIYTAKDVRRLIKWLEKAAAWLEKREAT